MERYTYSDYCEAGKPFGKMGFVRWLQEKYEAVIQEKETEIAKLKTDPARAQCK